MARIEECLLLEGVVPTDEFVLELHANIGCGGFQLERIGDFAIYLKGYALCRRPRCGFG